MWGTNACAGEPAFLSDAVACQSPLEMRTQRDFERPYLLMCFILFDIV